MPEDVKLELILTNEKEWRRHILSELSDIKKIQMQDTLKINTIELKLSAIGFIAGGIGSFIYKLIASL